MLVFLIVLLGAAYLFPKAHLFVLVAEDTHPPEMCGQSNKVRSRQPSRKLEALIISRWNVPNVPNVFEHIPSLSILRSKKECALYLTMLSLFYISFLQMTYFRETFVRNIGT